MTTTAAIRREIADLNREFDSTENRKSGKLKAHQFEAKLSALNEQLREAICAEADAEVAAVQRSRSAPAKPTWTRFNMPPHRMAKLAALNAKLDHARDHDDAEAFSDAVNDEQFTELLAYSSLCDQVGATDLDDLSKTRVLLAHTQALVMRAYRFIELRAIKQRVTERRVSEVTKLLAEGMKGTFEKIQGFTNCINALNKAAKAQPTMLRDAIDGAVTPLLERIADLEQRVSKADEEAKARDDDLHRRVDAAASPDGFDVSLNGRTLAFELSLGGDPVRKEVKVPLMIYKGVYRSGDAYEQGDTVTFAGALWVAMSDTAEKPPSDSWKLCVQKGRDLR